MFMSVTPSTNITPSRKKCLHYYFVYRFSSVWLVDVRTAVYRSKNLRQSFLWTLNPTHCAKCEQGEKKSGIRRTYWRQLLPSSCSNTPQKITHETCWMRGWLPRSAVAGFSDTWQSKMFSCPFFCFLNFHNIFALNSLYIPQTLKFFVHGVLPRPAPALYHPRKAVSETRAKISDYRKSLIRSSNILHVKIQDHDTFLDAIRKQTTNK